MGRGRSRKWFRSRISGPAGERAANAKLDAFLDGPEPCASGTLAEFVETVWWPHIKVKTKKATRIGYMYALGKHIRPLQSLQLECFTFDTLQSFANSLTESGLSAKSVRNVFSVLCSALDLAFKTRRLSHQDWKIVALPEVPKAEAEGHEWGNVLKLCKAAQGTPMEGPVFAASHLGLRRNEVCGLKVPHVEILKDRAVVTLQDNRQPHGEESRLKGKKSGAAVRLHVPREWGVRLLSFAGESLYLFNHKGKPVNTNWVSKQMPDLCEKAGVSPVTFHSLRHSCATTMRKARVPETLISASVMRHSSLETTMIYFDEKADEQLDAFTRLASNGGHTRTRKGGHSAL